MSIKITDDSMTSDLTRHAAELWPLPGEESPTMWRVSWYPVRPLVRNEAITAMTLAETTGATKDLRPGHRLWPHVISWAAELGLTVWDAVRLVTLPAGHEGD